MFSRLVSRFTRLILGGLILVVTALAMPAQVSAATPSIEIVAVKADESVTFRTADFPANTKFLIRMDTGNTRAENGIAVAELNSGNGGAFEATVAIPAQLKGTRTIAIRLESDSGYFAYNWFTNNTSTTN